MSSINQFQQKKSSTTCIDIYILQIFVSTGRYGAILTSHVDGRDNKYDAVILSVSNNSKPTYQISSHISITNQNHVTIL